MDSEIKATILKALEASRGDDLFRAKLSFSSFTPEEMEEQHGQSGFTRKEILNSYIESDNKVQRAINYVTNI